LCDVLCASAARLPSPCCGLKIVSNWETEHLQVAGVQHVLASSSFAPRVSTFALLMAAALTAPGTFSTHAAYTSGYLLAMMLRQQQQQQQQQQQHAVMSARYV
jgi:hypothetical protein